MKTKRSHKIAVPLTAEEVKAIRVAASQKGTGFHGEFIREIVLEEIGFKAG